MGVYRRKNKEGVQYGPWIMQYPGGIDPRTGKIKYACEKAGHSKRVADLAFAKKVLEWDKKKHLGLETKKEYTFRELVDWYLELPKVKEKRSYREDVSRSLILKEAFSNFSAREIRPAMIESFQYDLLHRQCQRKKSNYLPATVNRMLALMKRIYSLAVREDFVEKNPCLKVSIIPENNARDRVITREEFERLISDLPKHAAQIVTVAYYTGMRSGEIFNLTWKKINMREGFIDLEAEDTKNSEPRRIYLNDVLLNLLAEVGKIRHIDHQMVFTFNGKSIKTINKPFKKACRLSGIRDLRVHDLRHTFNTNMRKAGVDRSVIMKITGHKSYEMFERYNTIDSKDAQDALVKLNDFLSCNSGQQPTTAIVLQERKKGEAKTAMP